MQKFLKLLVRSWDEIPIHFELNKRVSQKNKAIMNTMQWDMWCIIPDALKVYSQILSYIRYSDAQRWMETKLTDGELPGTSSYLLRPTTKQISNILMTIFMKIKDNGHDVSWGKSNCNEKLLHGVPKKITKQSYCHWMKHENFIGHAVLLSFVYIESMES